jgi:hypothetical protein
MTPGRNALDDDGAGDRRAMKPTMVTVGIAALGSA